jgi:phospholipid/cholesterol/gamma-HCH transport system substrate-binding protein
METRANYALIGAFTLAVIAVGFVFVYWLQGAGHSAAGTNTYKLMFSGSISGLGAGSVVLFNGVRVGQVKEINLVPQDPSRVYALIDVDARVPIRTDTKARIESTGFTGIASVGLAGGSVDAPPLPKGPDGGPGVIIAERSDFQDVMEAARQIAGQTSDLLGKANRIIDAVDPAQVKSTLRDVAELSAKLDADADKVDSVLTNLNGFPATGDSKGAFGEIAAAAKSLQTLADNLDVRTKELTANLDHFTSSGLRQYEALAVDGRKTLKDIDDAVRSIEANPQQFIFGKKQGAPQVSSSR